MLLGGRGWVSGTSLVSCFLVSPAATPAGTENKSVQTSPNLHLAFKCQKSAVSCRKLKDWGMKLTDNPETSKAWDGAEPVLPALEESPGQREEGLRGHKGHGNWGSQEGPAPRPADQWTLQG